MAHDRPKAVGRVGLCRPDAGRWPASTALDALALARIGSRELFTLAVVASAIGIAYGAAALFGVSFALCAFFAGMVMRESELSHRAAHE